MKTVYSEVKTLEGPSWCCRVCPCKVFRDADAHTGAKHITGDRLCPQRKALIMSESWWFIIFNSG